MPAKEMRAIRGDQFRLMCPRCETMWSTLEVPSECETCGARVTFRALSYPSITEDKENPIK